MIKSPNQLSISLLRSRLNIDRIKNADCLWGWKAYYMFEHKYLMIVFWFSKSKESSIAQVSAKFIPVRFPILRARDGKLSSFLIYRAEKHLRHILPYLVDLEKLETFREVREDMDCIRDKEKEKSKLIVEIIEKNLRQERFLTYWVISKKDLRYELDRKSFDYILENWWIPESKVYKVLELNFQREDD